MDTKQKFIIIGHRGSVGLDGVGENTIPAFKRALLDMADCIEFDVHVVSDSMGGSHLIVMHDDDVHRTTNGIGNLDDIGYEQLRELKVGDETTEITDQYGETVPTADEVLKLIAESDAKTGHHTTIIIELKGARTVQPTVDLIRSYVKNGLGVERFIVSSFDYARLEEFHRLLPEIEAAAVFDGNRYMEAQESLTPLIEQARKLESSTVIVGNSFMDAETIKSLHAENLKALVWEDVPHKRLSSGDDFIINLFQLGVDGVFASRPGIDREMIRAVSTVSKT